MFFISVNKISLSSLATLVY